MKKIVLFGPLGNNIPKERIGGAEKGCRRSICLLEENNFDVIAIEKPTMFYGIKRFVTGYYHCIIKLIGELRKKDESVFYLIGFYDKQIYLEAFMIFLAHLFKRKIVYEPKNGGLVKLYNSSSAMYKKASDYIFRNSNVIFCQGMEYVRFLEKSGYVNQIYLPNYISNENQRYYLENDEQSRRFDIIYVGRLTKDKNVELVIDAFEEIVRCKKDARLVLIGGAEDTYKRKLMEKLGNCGILKSTVITGVLQFKDISKYLMSAKYFVFPSNNKSEGHSNALTEAMYFGVVPIASDIGFNRDVIGNDELIVEKYNASDYASKILAIEEDRHWLQLSTCVRKRVLNEFTENAVIDRYLGVLNKL